MVKKQDGVWEIALKAHKTAYRGKKRIIYAGPKAQAVLEPYLKRAAEKPCFSPIEAQQQRREARSLQRTTPLNQGNRKGYTSRTRRELESKVVVHEQYNTASYGAAIEYACKQAWPAPEGLPADGSQ